MSELPDLDWWERALEDSRKLFATVYTSDLQKLVRRVKELEAAIGEHRNTHAAWSDRREGWEEATFEADYELWGHLGNGDEDPRSLATDDPLAVAHQIHYRQCNCLDDSGICCVSNCACRERESS